MLGAYLTFIEVGRLPRSGCHHSLVGILNCINRGNWASLLCFPLCIDTMWPVNLLRLFNARPSPLLLTIVFQNYKPKQTLSSLSYFYQDILLQQWESDSDQPLYCDEWKAYSQVLGLWRAHRRPTRLPVLLPLGTSQGEVKFCDVSLATVPCGLCGEHRGSDLLSSHTGHSTKTRVHKLTSCLSPFDTDSVLGPFSAVTEMEVVVQSWERHETRAILELNVLPGVGFYWALMFPCRSDLNGRLADIGFAMFLQTSLSWSLPISSLSPCFLLHFLPFPFIFPFSCCLHCFLNLSLAPSSVSQSLLPFVTEVYFIFCPSGSAIYIC